MKVSDQTMAEAFLIQALFDGPRPVRELTTYAARNNINEHTLRIAGRALTTREKDNGVAVWELDRISARLWVERYRAVISRIEQSIAGFEKETSE